LRILASVGNGRETVLALPLSRLIAKVVRVPSGEDPAAYAKPLLQAISPFPDDDLTVGVETMRETDSGTVVFAAALPESAADDIGEALDAEKLSVVRVDALALGELRGLWGELRPEGRKLLVMVGADALTLIAFDGDLPVSVRSVSADCELGREALLSLIEAEDFAGAAKLSEIVVAAPAGEDAAAVESALSRLAPVRRVETHDPDAGLKGVAERSEEQGTLDALPASWREVLAETRFKRKLAVNLAVAGGVWILAMSVLFGVPAVYGMMADGQKEKCRLHASDYKAVAAMRDKVKLVRRYSDHSRGALEIMKAVSDRLPEGIELSSWNFRREDKKEDGVRVSGEADSADAVYEFKDLMAKLSAGEDEDTEQIFKSVKLIGPSASRGGKQKFDLECRYQGDEE